MDRLGAGGEGVPVVELVRRALGVVASAGHTLLVLGLTADRPVRRAAATSFFNSPRT